MKTFKVATLPFKHFSDFSMSSDGKCITIVSHLSKFATPDNYLKSFYINNTPYLFAFSGIVNGSIDRSDYIKNLASGLSSEIYSGNWFADGSVFSSWDYGNTWYIQSGLKPRNWVSCDMSADGKIQAVVGRGIYKDFFEDSNRIVENTPTHIYISYDSGRSWEPKCTSRTWNAITVSPGGNYLLSSDTYLYNGEAKKPFHHRERPHFENNIFYSNTSGLGWELAYNAPLQSYYLNSNYENYKYVNFGSEGLIGSLYDDFSYFGKKQAKISSDGKYHLIASKNAVIVNSGSGDYNSTSINPSYIHSVMRFVDNGDPENLTGRLFSKFLPVSCDMSTNGQYQIIGGQGFIGGASGYDSVGNYSDIQKHSSYFSQGVYGNSFSPDLYYSKDYGKNWEYFKGLESGMYCVSVSISDDFKYIDLLAVPNTKLERDRFGSVYTHADLFNFNSQFYNTNSDIVHLSSENSGLTWEKRDVNASCSMYLTGIVSAPNAIINQFPLGVSEFAELSEESFFNFQNNYLKYVFYNYPEIEYLNKDTTFLNIFNSKVINSNDGLKTAILHNGALLLSSSFPINQPAILPSKREISFPPSFSNWSLLKTGERKIVDATIGGNGQYISYIVNSGDLYSNQSSDFSDFYEMVYYSGHIDGKTHGISVKKFSKNDSFRKGLIYSSQNFGSSWNIAHSIELSGSFNPQMYDYGKIKFNDSGFFKNNLSKISSSDDGRYQVAFCDSILPSGYDLISTSDGSLSLSRSRFFTPFYYSSNFGSSWSTKYIETTYNGIDPEDLYVSNDGNTIYFIGENTGTVYFQDIRTDKKRERPDLLYIDEEKILPFSTNYYKNTTSYSLPKTPLPGRAVYYSIDAGASWSKISLIDSIYYSGMSSPQYGLNLSLVSCINSNVPSEYALSQKVDTSILPSVNINSFSPSSWTTTSPFKSSNSLISVEGILQEFSSVGVNNIESVRKNPYARGIIRWNHSANSFLFYNSLVQDHGDISPEFYNSSGVQSLNFKKIKIAQSQPSIVAGLCEPKFYNTHSDGILGNKLNSIPQNLLQNLYISYDSGKSWRCSSAVDYISQLNISNDGKCISYLSSVDPSDIFLDEGSRYGVPYVSQNYGHDFFPVLKWEPDIEYRRCAFVGNEFLSKDDVLFNSSDLISGKSESKWFDFALNVLGTKYEIGNGFIDLNNFYYTGTVGLGLSGAFASGLLGKSADCRNYAFLSDPLYFTKSHISNRLSCFKMNFDGSKQIIIEDGSRFSEKNLFNGNAKERFLEVYSENKEYIFDGKIYYNNVSGFYSGNNVSYITGSGQSTLTPGIASDKKIILFDSGQGVNSIPSPKYNTKIDRRGNIYFGDKTQIYTYQSGVKSKLFSVRNNQILFGITGEKIFTAKETSFVTNETENSILYSGYNLYTTDDSYDSYLTTYPTSITVDSTYRLPSGLYFDDSSLSAITGIPTETGIFNVKILQEYSLEKAHKFEINSYIQMVIYTGKIGDKDVVSLYSAFESPGIELIDAIIKSGNFYETFYNGYRSNNILGLSGYGPQVMLPASNTTGFGIINNPTGMFNLISYETGTLSGVVPPRPALEESFTWNNTLVVGVGRSGYVFYDHITGQTESYNYAIVDESKLKNNDSITINDIIFTYKENQAEADENIFWFNTVSELMTYAAPIALVTGYYDGTRLHMYSIIEGDDANWFTLRRDCEDLSAVVIPNIYFVSGRDLRVPATNWSGDYFSGVFEEITVINSGFYKFTGQIPNDYFLSGSGIVWDADLNKTMTVKTGIYTATGYGDFTGFYDVNYSNYSNIFSGRGLIPSGQDYTYTGVGVKINRDLYDINDTGYAYYRVTGKDIDYSGYILI